jgi:hypothetical protein
MDMRRSVCAGAALAAVVTLGAACGGEGSKSSSPADWKKKQASLVAAFDRDLADAVNNINQGARDNTVASCNQVKETAQEVKTTALPAPVAAVDTALTKSVASAIQAADDCLKGARNTDARAVEAAQREFADARKSFDEADTAIAAS